MATAASALGASIWMVAAAGCGARSDRAEPPADAEVEAVVAVRARSLEVRAFEEAVTAPGEWRSGGDLVVAAPFPALVDSLAARAGDRVAAGQTVGWLVTRESAAALRGAEMLARLARDAADRTEAGRAVDLARRDLVRAPLAAPRAGIVVRRSVEPGAQIDEGTEILAVVPDGAIVFEAHVPAAQAARLRPGQRGAVAETGRAPRAVVLERVLPVASASDQTTLAWLALVPGSSPLPDLGRFGTATISVGAPHQGLAVPDSAVVEDDLTGETRVAVVDPESRAAWRPVTLGIGADGWHELLAPAPALAPGTLVIVEGQRGLPDSTRVKLTP